MFKEIRYVKPRETWMLPFIKQRSTFFLVDDNFTDECECEILSKDTINEWPLGKQSYSASTQIIASVKVIIRIYTQRQGDVAKNIWLYFRKLEKEHNYSMENLVQINKERNPSYTYHEKEIDELVAPAGL